MNRYYLYILASRRHHHLSIGVTTDLAPGIRQHRRRTARQLGRERVWQKLVYVEAIASLDEAVEREISLRRVSRARLCSLVESVNPGWDNISIRGLRRAGFG